MRGTPAELAALIGQAVVSIRRRGKFLLIDLDRDRIACNPMLTGRFQLAAPGDKLPSKTAVVLGFGARSGGPPRDAAGWTRKASWLPGPEARPEVRYRDPTQMGKIYLVSAGIDRPVPGLGGPEQGPDADDPSLTLDVWRDRIRRHPGELKNLLRNQAFVAGIGNAYSDEILWEAQLAPLRRRSTLKPEEIDRLYAAMRSVLADATVRLRTLVPPDIQLQHREFLKVHLRGGEPCPRCGRVLRQIGGDEATTFCRTCQPPF